eukprot:TRINITY_DN21051_c0_g1_i2.p1 TRINITY_DN21051_c0_g1~~TRINITY_DN21051_c0_g1_i2.p1  ORF type:complete len:143 (+),score=9.10 TRINITY_DN21051_c0_g1_i2:191-619(+)
MSRDKRPKYETVQYKPPTPEVFGNAVPDFPVGPPVKVESMNVDRPRHRPKLQDRLAVYEDDNPQCQRFLCLAGIALFPLWMVGAVMYLRTPTNKVLSREAGFKNLVLSILSIVVLIVTGFRFRCRTRIGVLARCTNSWWSDK